MAYTEAQLKIIKDVRAQTTDDVVELPDAKILDFADVTGRNFYADGLDLYGVIADAWIYLSRADRYGAESNGNLAASQPQAGWKAGYYLSLSRRGGAALVQGTLRRTDLTNSAVASGSEFGV